ncbi:MAG TPA: methyltransferase, TIGR04325 family [Candidatus Limnocylindrales bacterium]|nr:methyltransferase, TIGR04325 family [Candidatus Limnocylindrales bacterium]
MGKLKSTLKRILNPFTQKAGQKQYTTYETALADCTEHGYENEDIIEVVLQKTQKYRDSLLSEGKPIRLSPTSAYSLCSLLASLEALEIRVIDFGGACGAHYYLARAVLPPSYKLRWIVVETPKMIQKAAEIFTNDELTFSSNLREAADSLRQIDLLHTSGTLQYVNNPCEYLRTLVSIHATHILFNRLNLTKGSQDIITIQESWLSCNGPGAMPSGVQDRKVRYPVVFLRESTFYDAISKDYDVVMTFDEPGDVFSIESGPIFSVGLLARRKR